jgi:3-hydroxyacyl-CoA dehydrogenase / enoyl-CoA hydratase / 3-hydroxybutyryl-CoA epimerase
MLPTRRKSCSPVGKAGFVARAKELAAKYGDRFNPPASLQA